MKKTNSLKHSLPLFLEGKIELCVYRDWLAKKAATHVKRDRARGNLTATGAHYRAAIHAAVMCCEGRDAYTGELLDWTLLQKYRNDESATGGRKYKHGFAKLPTVDHIGDGTGVADFRICSWRTNDAKHDLDIASFLNVCRAVLEHHGFTIHADSPMATSSGN